MSTRRAPGWDYLLLTAGRLRVTVNGERHDLKPGDCLRYRLFGASRFNARENIRPLFSLHRVRPHAAGHLGTGCR